MPAKQQLLFVQGGGRGTHDEWDNKLVDSLKRELGQGYDICYPRMPREDEPDYSRWKTALEGELQTLQGSAILVAHSVGGTILVKMLSEQPAAWKLAGIFLLAVPFVGEGGWPSDGMRLAADLGAQLPAGVPIHFFHGLEDHEVPPAHIELYARVVPQARIHRLQGLDHQLNNDLKDVAHAILALKGASGENAQVDD